MTKTRVGKPSADEIKAGTVVLINGYQVGVTVVALASGWNVRKCFPHLDPFSAWFYTTAYRWGLRHLSMIPEWLKSSNYDYIDTQRAWRRRFYYMDRFVPEWMRWFLPHVWDWKVEEHQWRRYHRYAEPSFSKHFHYPGEVFDDWKSEESTETVENLDISDFSLDNNKTDY
ncbi:unnamed protein product [Parnassius mnemosyne]|uniref:Uncharacterized protein n=1 Tax=Parnassius mnemosyne TaxID=213953 RepID=A0AAV1L401_9NEOP